MRPLVAAAAVAVLLAVAAPSVEAGRKKKPPAPAPVEITYYMRNLDSDCGRDQQLELTLTDGPDELHCGMGIESGPANTLNETVGRRAQIARVRFDAVEGTPLVFDAARRPVATVYVRSPRPSAGPTELVASLVGVSGDEEVPVAAGSTAYTVSPLQEWYEIVIELETVVEADKVSYEGLRLYLHNRGPAPTHGVYWLENPASRLTMGVWAPA